MTTIGKIMAFLFLAAVILVSEVTIAGIGVSAATKECAARFPVWAELAFAVIALAAAAVIIRERKPSAQ